MKQIDTDYNNISEDQAILKRLTTIRENPDFKHMAYWQFSQLQAYIGDPYPMKSIEMIGV